MMTKLKGIYDGLSKPGRILFFSAVMCLLLMLMDLMVLGPILKHLKELDGEIRNTHQAIERNLRIISFKDSILREYMKYKQYLDPSDRSQEEIISHLLKKIENLATRHNIKINNVMPGEIEEKPIYQVYTTSLDFEGALADVIVFMNELEESDNLFQITKYTLLPKSKTGEALAVTLDMSRILIEAEDLDDVFEMPGPAEDEMDSMDAAPSGEKPMDVMGAMDSGYGDGIQEEFADDFKPESI